MNYQTNYKAFIWVFSVLLVFIVPFGVYSPQIISGVSMPKIVSYISLSSIIIGVWFLMASTQLKKDQILKFSKSEPWFGFEAAILCVPYVIYKGTNNFLRKWLK